MSPVVHNEYQFECYCSHLLKWWLLLLSFARGINWINPSLRLVYRVCCDCLKANNEKKKQHNFHTNWMWRWLNLMFIVILCEYGIRSLYFYVQITNTNSINPKVLLILKTTHWIGNAIQRTRRDCLWSFFSFRKIE